MKTSEIGTYARAISISGAHSLGGKLAVAGYKHALTLLMAASILVGNDVAIHNAPDNMETRILLTILQDLDMEIDFFDHTLSLNSKYARNKAVSRHLSQQIHSSLYLIPALLGRFGRVEFGGAGGDQFIGPLRSGGRPFSHIVSVMEKFCATFEEIGDGVVGKCRTLHAQEIDIKDFEAHQETGSGPCVSGATKTAVLAAAVADGTSVIHNPWNKEAAYELLAFLQVCGCRMKLSSTCWEIEGGIDSVPVVYSLISDVTEIITFIACAVYLRSSILLTNISVGSVRQALRPELEILEGMGVHLIWGQDWIQVIPPDRLIACDVVATSRGLNTDSHPFFTLMLLTADRPSTITDYVWQHRFAYVDHLNRLGASLDVDGCTVYVTPKRPSRSGVTIEVADTRAGAVAILAALGIEGSTIIQNMSHLHRGYESIVDKLQALGAEVEVY